MKYLLFNKFGSGLMDMPAEKREKLINGSGEFYKKNREAGKLLEMYVIPNLKRNVAIWEVESPTEIDRLFLENPMSPYMDSEVYMLSDWDAHVKAAQELLG
jgi:muconolactone delta-isomerase